VPENPSMKIVEEISKDYLDDNLFFGEFSDKSISVDFKLLEVSVTDCSQVHSCFTSTAAENKDFIFGIIISE
jgi:hypothetical protein